MKWERPDRKVDLHGGGVEGVGQMRIGGGLHERRVL